MGVEIGSRVFRARWEPLPPIWVFVCNCAVSACEGVGNKLGGEVGDIDDGRW